MKNKKTPFIITMVMMIILVLVGQQLKIFGIKKENVLDKAREVYLIDDSWRVVQQIDEPYYSILFYSPQKTGHVYAIYKKEYDFSLGYSELTYGYNEEITDHYVLLQLADNAVVISLNKDQIDQISYHNQTIDIDPKKPFIQLIENCLIEDVELFSQGEKIH